MARGSLLDSTAEAPPNGGPAPVILSFDVEEHFRIEAATGLAIDPKLKEQYAERVEPATRWLLDQLDRFGLKATFFVVGQIARDNPSLVRAIHDAGHEVGSHGWDHRRVLAMTPDEFREDLRLSCDALEDATGAPVAGYRAPTFSILRGMAWALDVLAERGLLYDSSIYPVRHDRYGIPSAPRSPFLARGNERTILELPPVTLRLGKRRLPAGGGGYFRLFPLAVMTRALAQTHRECDPPAAMLYFHPWEFDPEQPRLPLRRLNRFRTYVGIGRSRGRLTTLLSRYRSARAVDVARGLEGRPLPVVTLDEGATSPGSNAPRPS
jgi:polysaccharide deacetylase family protein (PEP-CTERM system associated)